MTVEAHHRPYYFVLFVFKEESLTLATDHNVPDSLLLRRGIEVLLQLTRTVELKIFFADLLISRYLGRLRPARALDTANAFSQMELAQKGLFDGVCVQLYQM